MSSVNVFINSKNIKKRVRSLEFLFTKMLTVHYMLYGKHFQFARKNFMEANHLRSLNVTNYEDITHYINVHN